MTSYVFGRDLTEQQMLAAARAAQFPDGGNPEIPPAALPPEFRRFAAAPVVPNGTYGELIELKSEDQRTFVRISAYDGDAPADVLTRFWNATVVNQGCSDFYPELHRRVDGTDVFLASNASSDVVNGIAAGLTTTDQAGFDAFRAKVGELSGAALLGGCQGEGPDAGVIVDGTTGGVRWALAMSIGEIGSFCTGFIIDGKVEPGVSGGGGGGPMVGGAGSYGIELLGGGGVGFAEVTVSLFGGTVPAAATRVVISDRTGATTEAELVRGGSDPTRRYLAGLLRPDGFASGTTIVAYDKSGQEVGRYVSPV